MLAAHVEEWVSEARFEPFLRATEGDREAAAELYEWHAQMSGSCFGALHHFEVLVRTAIDRQLGAGQPNEPIGDTWLLDRTVLTEPARDRVEEVVDRLGREREPITRAGVVAGLTFAFWKNMFIRDYEELWRQSLRHAFRGARVRDDVLQPMTRLHLWRNRVAHHASLLGERLDLRVEDMLQVAGFIAPEAAEWLESQSTMPAVLAARP